MSNSLLFTTVRFFYKMLKLEIKPEFTDNIQTLCRGCLSIGRKLTPIEKFSDQLSCKFLFKELYETSSSCSSIEVCWECISVIKKVSQYQQKVKKANEMIQHGQTYVFESLSNLSTVIINDTHPDVVYVNESSTQSFIHPNDIDGIDESNDSIPHFDDTLINNEDKKHIIDVKVETVNISDKEIVKNNEDEERVAKTKVKYKNKWAQRKALLNKTPKFKILTKEELVVDKYFKRVQVDVETLKSILETERDRDKFRSSSLKCVSCVMVFKSQRLLFKHKEKYHKEAIGRYICDICNSRLQRKSDLVRHIRRHTIKYQCTLCESSCRRKDDRTIHLLDHKQVLQCLKCGLSFGSRQEFHKHHKEWHEKFICDHCGVTFKMRYCIENHIKKQHNVKYECGPCDKRFARYSGLWLHKKTCHTAPGDGAPPTPAYCVECDKRFVDVYRYKWHLYNSVKHTAKKKTKIPCPDCGKEFSKKIYMKDHFNLVHLKKFKYRCEECDKNFVRNADLMKHKKRVHEGFQPPRNKICYVCGRGFTTNAILTHHLRTHTGERPHACGACPATFAQRVSLVAHLRAPHRKRDST